MSSNTPSPDSCEDKKSPGPAPNPAVCDNKEDKKDDSELSRTLVACNSKQIDTPTIQSMHQAAYQGLIDAFDAIDAYAQRLGAQDSSVDAVMTAWKSPECSKSVNEDHMRFYYDFSVALKNDLKIANKTCSKYGYVQELPINKGSATTTSDVAMFFNFALSRVPQGSYRGNDAKIADADFVQMAGGVGAMACPAPYDDKKTYYDFHVTRLAQLVMAKTMFSLAMSCTHSLMMRKTADKDAPANSENIGIVGQVITKIEKDLTANIDTQTAADPMQKGPQNIYMTIKGLSENNLASSQNNANIQSVIENRRKNLQTALNAEMQLDSIQWWATFMMWLWVAVFIVGVVLVAYCVLASQFIIVYIAFGIIVAYEVVLMILKYFNINSTYFNIQGIDDSIVLALGLPGLAN